MRTFKQFLEARAPIVFASWSSDGRVTVYIRGERYVYATDAAFTYANHRFRAWAERAPGRALAKMRKMSGTYLLEGPRDEPEPAGSPPPAEQPEAPPAPKFVQGNLF